MIVKQIKELKILQKINQVLKKLVLTQKLKRVILVALIIKQQLMEKNLKVSEGKNTQLTLGKDLFLKRF